MIKRLYFFLTLLSVILFAACNKDNGPDNPVSNDSTRTVLVYMVAQNTLSSFVSDDIDEMVRGMSGVDPSLYNLLVYVDDYSAPVLYHLAKDKSGNVIKDVVKKYSEQVSTDVDVMKEVVSRAFTEYPADSYGLVYWSHGEGWLPQYQLFSSSKVSTRYVGVDGISVMSIQDLASALTGTPHLDFLMFDACYMQSVEVDYELRDYTDYVVASPTEIPGPGAPYDKVVSAMFTNYDDTQSLAIAISKAYYDPYAAIYDGGATTTNTDWTGGVSIGVVKTAALDNLATVTASILPASIDNSSLAGSVFNYDKRTKSSNYYVGYYDMAAMIKSLTDASVYATWQTAFDEAIIYWDTTPMNFTASFGGKLFSMDGTSGLSHYIPSSPSSTKANEYHSCAWYKDLDLQNHGW